MKKIALLALASLAFVGASANAASVTDSFQVTLEIRESCTLSVSAADVDFGASDRSSDSSLDASSTLNVDCTVGTPWTLGLNATAGPVSATNRRMTNGSEFVGYGLYQDAARTQLFGNSVSTDVATGTGTGSAQTVPVFGRVLPSETNVPAGFYEDTVLAEVIY